MSSDQPHPRYRIGNVGIDCNDLDPMVAFWTAALGYEVKSRDDSHALLRDPAHLGPKLYLQVVPEPRVGKNRLHLDLYVVDADEAAAHLAGLGATRLRRFQTDDDTWVVLGDPEGNEFCVNTAGRDGVAQPFAHRICQNPSESGDDCHAAAWDCQRRKYRPTLPRA